MLFRSKRLAKVKAIRDTKVKRSAQPIAAPVQAPAAHSDADTEEEKKPVAAAPVEHVASDAPPETVSTAV